ncbi:MAG: 1-(5-phosphoribosyl)-5-amino-4-imidazole-carboxylate carboxylase, partial [Actinomycetota bacterium]
MTDDHQEELGFAIPDHEREARWGLPEAVLGIGKTPEQIREIVARLRERNSGPILVTRTTPDAFAEVRKVAPEAEFHEAARLIRVA